jgi:glycine dehydrogenase subunit 1
MTFIPHTDADRRAMLSAIGVESVEELFADIPAHLRAARLNIPSGRSEWAVRRNLRALARKNATDLVSFLGGGFYDHFIPAAVDALASRPEFYTSYTPYQPELSQGMLQATYEYQSAICRLTQMEVANASLYDGGTALFEAMMMALRLTGRRRVVIDGAVSPIYRKMLLCYTSNLSIELAEVPPGEGRADREAIARELARETAAVILQNPNFFGLVDDVSDIVAEAHKVGALAILSAYPISLGLLKTPGEMGADIATGEGQSLGLPLSFGGPYLGFLATRREFVRKMPGRIVGATRDRQGRRAFVLALQAREQHIRREKATSNICSNEALCALRAVIYLSLLGKEGLHEVARTCAAKAAYARRRLLGITGVEALFPGPVFNEFALQLPIDAGEVVNRLIEKGFAAGFPLGRYYPELGRGLLVAVTEQRTREEIGMLAEGLEAVL